MSLWNVIALSLYAGGVVVTHLKMRNWWTTACAALLAFTVDGLLVPFGAIGLGFFSLLVAKRGAGEPQRQG